MSDSSLSGFAAAVDDCRDETREDLRSGEGEDDLRLFPVTSSKIEETRVFVSRSTLAVDAVELTPLSSCRVGKLEGKKKQQIYNMYSNRPKSERSDFGVLENR